MYPKWFVLREYGSVGDDLIETSSNQVEDLPAVGSIKVSVARTKEHAGELYNGLQIGVGLAPATIELKM